MRFSVLLLGLAAFAHAAEYAKRTVDFNARAGAYTSAMLGQDFGNGSYYSGRGHVEIKNGAYKVTFVKGKKVDNTGSAAAPRIPAQRQYTLQYVVKYHSAFQEGLHGKQMGFNFGAGYNGGRGALARTNGDGGSVRLQFDSKGETIRNQLYVYYAEMSGTYGNNPGGQSFSIPRGAASTIRLTVTLNSAADKKDGQIEVWCNGDKKIDVKGIRFVNKASALASVNAVSLEAFPGGAGAYPGSDQFVYFDDIAWQSGRMDAPTVPVTPTDPVVPAEPVSKPGQILDLKPWKIALPIAGSGSEWAKEVKQPELNTYAIHPWFTVSTIGSRKVVLFRANAGGARTSTNTLFSRSELREMNPANNESASWGFNDGKAHVMRVTAAVFKLPPKRPKTSIAQIHDNANDVLMLAAEGDPAKPAGPLKLLLALDDDSKQFTIDADYRLGEFFTLAVLAKGGKLTVLYNGMETPVRAYTSFPNVKEKNGSLTGMYFKAGCYIQSNVSKYGESPDAYAEVGISALTVKHGTFSTTEFDLQTAASEAGFAFAEMASILEEDFVDAEAGTTSLPRASARPVLRAGTGPLVDPAGRRIPANGKASGSAPAFRPAR